jgi:hypothetical protein
VQDNDRPVYPAVHRTEPPPGLLQALYHLSQGTSCRYLFYRPVWVIIPRLILSQNIFLIVNEAFGIALPEKGSGKFKRPWRRSGRIIRINGYDLAGLLLPSS